MDTSSKELKLRIFFVEHLRRLIGDEIQVANLLPKIIASVSSNEVKSFFGRLFDQTQTHITRLETSFVALNELTMNSKSNEMDNILHEVDPINLETEDCAHLRDAALIILVKKVAKYKIEAYSHLFEFSEIMGNEVVSQGLHISLEEEKSTDEKLSGLADSAINNIIGTCR